MYKKGETLKKALMIVLLGLWVGMVFGFVALLTGCVSTSSARFEMMPDKTTIGGQIK